MPFSQYRSFTKEKHQDVILTTQGTQLTLKCGILRITGRIKKSLLGYPHHNLTLCQEDMIWDEIVIHSSSLDDLWSILWSDCTWGIWAIEGKPHFLGCGSEELYGQAEMSQQMTTCRSSSINGMLRWQSKLMLEESWWSCSRHEADCDERGGSQVANINVWQHLESSWDMQEWVCESRNRGGNLQSQQHCSCRTQWWRWWNWSLYSLGLNISLYCMLSGMITI